MFWALEVVLSIIVHERLATSITVLKSEGSFGPFKGFSPAAPSTHSEGCQSPCRQEVNLLVSSSFSHWHRRNFDNLVTVLNNLFKNPIAFNLFGGNLRRNFFEKNNTIPQLQKLK